MANQRTYLIATLLHCALLVILVPTARPIQTFVQASMLSSSTALLQTFVISVIVFTCAAVTYWNMARRRNSALSSTVYTTGLILLLLPTFFYSVAAVELAHIPLYGLLAIFSWQALETFPFKKRTLTTLVIVLVMSVLDEILQGLHPARFFDTRDIILNCWGGLMGLLTVYICSFRIPAPNLSFLSRDQ